MTRSHKWWWATAAYAIGVLVLSVVPVDVDVAAPHLDKAVHLCEYLVFAWLLMQALHVGHTHERSYLLWVWMYATSYGLLIELIQALVPWRSADVADALANALGAAVGVWAGRYFPRDVTK